MPSRRFCEGRICWSNLLESQSSANEASELFFVLNVMQNNTSVASESIQYLETAEKRPSLTADREPDVVCTI